MVESGVDARASDTTGASEGDCMGRFSKVLKYSWHLAATDALSDSGSPSCTCNEADEVAHFCFSCQNEAKAPHHIDDSHPCLLPTPSIAACHASVTFSVALPGICIPLHLPFE